MSNIKGPVAGRPLRLMPWQRLVFANLLGFVERGTTTRRFRQAVIFVPRGDGKTSIAAPLARYLSFLDGEGGAEGQAAVVTRDQASRAARGDIYMCRCATPDPHGEPPPDIADANAPLGWHSGRRIVLARLAG